MTIYEKHKLNKMIILLPYSCLVRVVKQMPVRQVPVGDETERDTQR